MKRLSPETIFNSEGLNHNLVSKSIKGGISAVSSQGVLFAIRMSGMVVLARLLTPADYGVVAMVVGVVGFVTLLKDAGLSVATIQRERITHAQISNLFWLNFLLSSLLGVIVLVGSPLIASFYGRPELANVAALMSVSFFVSGLTIQHDALLRRHMQFGALAFTQIASQCVSQLVTIWLALLGWHYWALVVGTLATVISATLVTFWFCPWVPGSIQRGTGIRDMLGFGKNLVGFNFLNYFAKTSDKILVGKFVGAEALGLYSRAYTLFMMPFNQIRTPMVQVALPVLSSLQNQPERYAKYYLKLVEIMASLMLPLSLYCGLEADFLVNAVLGPQWAGVVPVFQIFIGAAILQSISGTAGLVQLSCGFSKRYFYWGGINACVLVVFMILGLPFGIKGVAVSYTLANLMLFFPGLAYCLHKSPVNLKLVLKGASIPLIASLAAFGGAFFVKSLMSGESFLGHLIVLFVFVAIVVGSLSFQKSVRETFGLVLKGSGLESLANLRGF